MSRIFHPAWNTVVRAGLACVVLSATLAGAVGYALTLSPYWTGQSEAVEQPVPFSHEHHVGRLGIDCRYCHTPIEESSFVGMPPTKTCMNCHSQIWVGSEMLKPVRESFRTGQPIRWQRVHNLPDFVYFDHGIHVRKGIGCVTCHGRVDRMPLMWQAQPLTMEWCLDCHRQPDNSSGPETRSSTCNGNRRTKL